MTRHEKAILGVLGDLAVNVVTAEAEGVVAHGDRFFTRTHDRMSQVIGQSIRTRKTVRLPRAVTAKTMQLGFEHFVEGLEHEVALIAVSDEKRAHLFRYVAASSGTNGSVALPPQAGSLLQRRIDQGMRTKVIVTHNHPSALLKELLEDGLGFPLGPSGQDRTIAWRWRSVFNFAGTCVHVDLLLFESGCWRPIRAPSADQLVDLAASLLPRR